MGAGDSTNPWHLIALTTGTADCLSVWWRDGEVRPCHPSAWSETEAVRLPRLAREQVAREGIVRRTERPVIHLPAKA